MQFFGQVEPVPGRGELDLYGRTFQLTEGEIALRGPVEATTLDVTAQYRVPTEGDPDAEEVVINVHTTGRPDSLDLKFDADPAMGQDDIISYIVTGRPASDNPLLDQQGGGVDATQVAIGQLVILGGAAGEELGFDVFTIRQEPEQGLTLTAGRYLGSRVFASLHQPLRSAPARTRPPRPVDPGFELEYAWRRWLRRPARGQPAGQSADAGAPCVLSVRRWRSLLLAGPRSPRRMRSAVSVPRPRCGASSSGSPADRPCWSQTCGPTSP